MHHDPATHATHAVAPSTSWYRPAAHLLHASCAGASLYVPALQLAAAALPTGQNVPAPHVVQSDTLVIVTPTTFVVPPGHGSGAAQPSLQ